MNIVMVAAENGALKGGKVGGIGDVVRDIPVALAQRGHSVKVVCPGYGLFSLQPGAKLLQEVVVEFAGNKERVQVYALNEASASVPLYALEHPLFAAGGAGAIYCNDPDSRPFATDASKFALFCAAVAESVLQNIFDSIDVLHLHDWHAASLALLTRYNPRYQALNRIRMVYTVHNLALQGVRPFINAPSALETWFPKLKYNTKEVADPRWSNCYNPMRAGINLSDRVHLVSPTYAKEVLKPSNLQHGFFGGEGLEKDLQKALKHKRLHGILNGCEYPKPSAKSKHKPALADSLAGFETLLLEWMGKETKVSSSHHIALRRIAQLRAAAPETEGILVTSVGRLTDQKVSLLQKMLPSGHSALQEILQVLGERGVLIVLGSGDAQVEQFLTQVASTSHNFLFLKGYSERAAQVLYEQGDLFLMPSSFEPCGISQMLAMRSGQPCLVHEIGGLKDTVLDNKNGFSFSGDGQQEQASNLVLRFTQVLKMRKLKKWQGVVTQAAKARFLWSSVAKKYEELLYK